MLFVSAKYADAQKVKEIGNSKSYPYVGRIVAGQVNATDEYTMRTHSFPEVSLLNKIFIFSKLKKRNAEFSACLDKTCVDKIRSKAILMVNRIYLITKKLFKSIK